MSVLPLSVFFASCLVRSLRSFLSRAPGRRDRSNLSKKLQMSIQPHPLEHAVQEAREWIKDVESRREFNDIQSYHALRSVLHTLRDTLVPDEAMHLSSQLPHFVRGIYFEGYHLARKPEVKRDADKFLDVVRDQLSAANQDVDPRRACEAVFGTLSHRLSPGQADQVKNMLHAEVQAIWQEAA